MGKIRSMDKEKIPSGNPLEEVRQDTRAEAIALLQSYGNMTHFAPRGRLAEQRMFQEELQLDFNAEVELACMDEVMDAMTDFYPSPYQEDNQ